MKAQQPDYSWLANPEVFEVNRLDARSDHAYYLETEKALRKDRMELRQSLNGSWKFEYHKNQNDRNQNFYKPDFDSSRWVDVPVPGHVQFYGYDQHHYANHQYLWDGCEDLMPPAIPQENPVSSFIRKFNVDPALKGMKKELVFNGVDQAFYVWLNGEFVGFSEDSFTPARFDVTDLIKEDEENVLAVEVYKYSTATWVQDQDMFRLSGIFRDVDLYGIPSVHIKDLAVSSDLFDHWTRARIHISMTMANEEDHSFRIRLFDGENQVLEDISTNENSTFLDLENIHAWSSEDPYLYTLLIEVFDKNHVLTEAIPQRIGLREFKLENGLMKLNGKRIVFRGINRHEFTPTSGHVLDEKTMIEDAIFMKKNNINAVRTSHYPNDSRWYDICDEYGIYMVDEANMEAHGMWDKILKNIPYEQMVPGDHPGYTQMLLDRVNNMYQRDKNHSAILIWSPGNESWTGTNINKMCDFLRQDKTRIVQYEGCYWNPDKQWEVETDIETRMYPPAAVVEEYLKSSPKKPFVNLEYSHAMGNSLGGLNKYIELEEKYDQYQGGFIWDFSDQAIEYTDQYGNKVLGYGGDFMDRYPEYNFSGNGVLFADRTPSPKVQEMKYQYQDMKIEPDETGVTVWNKSLFTNTDKYEFVWTLSKEDKILQEGTAEVKAAPGEKVHADIPWDLSNTSGEVVKTVSARLKEDTLWASKGHEVAFGQQACNAFEELPEHKAPLKIVEGDRDIGVFGDHFSAKFTIPEGLTSLIFDGQEIMARAPRPVFTRASNDNQRGYRHDALTAEWFGASMFQSINLIKTEISKEQDELKLFYEYELPTIPRTKCDVTYTVRAPGIIRVDYKYFGVKGLPELPLIGLNFRLYNRYDQFKYYGRGPEENYADRKEGARLGVFESDARKNMAPYLVPQETGNRTDVRWLEVTDKTGDGLKFTMKGKPFEAKVLPYDFATVEAALHQEELPNPYYTFVTIMAKNMGVGGDDSWGCPVLPEYCIPSDQDIEFTFEISKA